MHGMQSKLVIDTICQKKRVCFSEPKIGASNRHCLQDESSLFLPLIDSDQQKPQQKQTETTWPHEIIITKTLKKLKSPRSPSVCRSTLYYTSEMEYFATKVISYDISKELNPCPLSLSHPSFFPQHGVLATRPFVLSTRMVICC